MKTHLTPVASAVALALLGTMTATQAQQAPAGQTVEVTGIRAQPAYVQAHRWLYAKTDQALGQSHMWDAKSGIGLCGDWCLGHRVENAFVSGLELALAIG
jgi:predicted NAD/FAD-dependent oxidoreductase